MRLVSPYAGVGIFTNNIEPMLTFWQEEVGLQASGTQTVSPGWTQHRFAMNGSVLAINHVEAPLPDGPGGYRELFIAGEIATHRRMLDPDGNMVTLVPFAELWCPGIAMRMAVRDEAAFHTYFGTVLELEEAGSHAYRCGDTVLLFEAEEGVAEAGPLVARGYRYLAVQVWDVDEELAAFVARGGPPGEAPTATAGLRSCFLQDPDGNRIEMVSALR